jgi:hypothetical protein
MAAALFAAGCSDDKPTSNNPPANTSTTIWNSAGYWETGDLDASSIDDYIFYSFATRDTVTLTLDQALNSTAWDIGFRRVSILVNSGASGAGTTRGLDLSALGEVDSTGFVPFSSLTGVDTTGLEAGSFSLTIDDWYSYNPVTHQFDITQYVYIMQDAIGGFVKFQITDMENPGMPPNMGTISIHYIYSADRSFNEPPDTLIFDATSGGPIYVDFSTGATVNPTDPRTSTDWDLAFENYEVHQNNTIFGSGDAGTYEVWQDQTDPADFDETPAMPDMAPAFPDDFGSPLTEWYNYTGPPQHLILSKGNVYLFKSQDLAVKFQIQSYYDHDSGDGGYYSFRWAELE